MYQASDLYATTGRTSDMYSSHFRLRLSVNGKVFEGWSNSCCLTVTFYVSLSSSPMVFTTLTCDAAYSNLSTVSKCFPLTSSVYIFLRSFPYVPQVIGFSSVRDNFIWVFFLNFEIKQQNNKLNNENICRSLISAVCLFGSDYVQFTCILYVVWSTIL